MALNVTFAYSNNAPSNCQGRKLTLSLLIDLIKQNIQRNFYRSFDAVVAAALLLLLLLLLCWCWCCWFFQLANWLFLERDASRQTFDSVYLRVLQHKIRKFALVEAIRFVERNLDWDWLFLNLLKLSFKAILLSNRQPMILNYYTQPWHRVIF